MRSVLLESREPTPAMGRIRYALWVWLPVGMMLLVIVRESTEGFSGLHTSAMLRAPWQAIFGVVTDERWERIHHALRKTGHFLGYGTLGIVWLRAWLLTWLLPMRRVPIAAWRRYALQMAICCTALVASLDELHQTALPSRTGLMQDVLLDTSGAMVLCGSIVIFWLVNRIREPSAI